MFKKVLIANRGAIACRIIRTLRAMNIASVAVYAEADADSLHVRMADESWSLGDGGAAQTYLNQDKLFDIIERSGAEAVHPGYGFLAENTGFARRCEFSGLRFIGPDASSMEAFALKHRARALAEQHGLPLVPGSALLSSLDEALSAAEAIGYPVMLKSSAGGGGIGMQACENAKVLTQAFDAVVRLSQNNFSDGSVFLEKFIARARHVEVQVFGDGQGHAVALGERDCSLQRRHQKVIEETPAPGLSGATRKALHETSTRLLAGVNYANAGTVEFIYDAATEKFYFLEVNTRLQVEHGVTEEVFGVDLVAWMIEQAASPMTDLLQRRAALKPSGHAIQARIYAENPLRQFQPSAGLLSEVVWPQARSDNGLRIDTWVETGVEVSSFFDPMLAKVIVRADDRAQAINKLDDALAETRLYGVASNLEYNRALLQDPVFGAGQMYTAYLSGFAFRPPAIEVLMPGTLSTIQDLNGRPDLWEVGVPPSGAFDGLSFMLGNRLIGNDDDCAGLEITINGPSLRFHVAAQVVVAGADIGIDLDGESQAMWTVISIAAGQTLALGSIPKIGARAYLLIRGGLQCPEYLGSRATFTLGQFGGHAGRALRMGDVLKICPLVRTLPPLSLPIEQRPKICNRWQLHVTYGPHGAPDFFTQNDIERLFDSEWEVHFNSSRTGIRLIGPKPEWARETGGEAGMHPSNIHDNAYAFGTVDFTGDMPVILGPDGPSLGGFVCPATVISADLWKLGQLRAGDKLRFVPVAMTDAQEAGLRAHAGERTESLSRVEALTCILRDFKLSDGLSISVRAAGDRFVLVEFGDQVLDLELRFQVAALHQMMEAHRSREAGRLRDLTPGIRSLQIHYDPERLPLNELLTLVEQACNRLEALDDVRVPSRIVHLPLSWDDAACHEAVRKYTQSVRADAPWCPDNIEFIRRINGLESVQAVRDIVFSAEYVVMGLGDVYLGAPVATPVDPRLRLVTTKYNPARTWTAENSVGIGGAYLCVYGMEGPGGYQFVGRTLQMWNRYRQTEVFEKPWLLRFFDRIRFYPVSHEELTNIRRDFPRGRYPLRIEEGEFSLAEHRQFMQANADSIGVFQQKRQQAFDAELQRWRDRGQLRFDASHQAGSEQLDDAVPEGCVAVQSHAAGNIWKVLVEPGQDVKAGDTLMILESMKMEIGIDSPATGKVHAVLKSENSQVASGQALMIIEPA